MGEPVQPRRRGGGGKGAESESERIWVPLTLSVTESSQSPAQKTPHHRLLCCLTLLYDAAAAQGRDVKHAHLARIIYTVFVQNNPSRVINYTRFVLFKSPDHFTVILVS